MQKKKIIESAFMKDCMVLKLKVISLSQTK